MTGLGLILSLASAALAVLGSFDQDLDVLLLSTRIAVDDSNRLVLAMVAMLWMAAVLRQSADGWPDGRYRLSFLLTQFGSLGAVISVDPVAYYTCFSLMTLASYGLVDVGPRARWAAGLYLGAALVGEMLLLAGLMMAGAAGAHPLIPWLVLFGLGAKLGLLPFHPALPPAYAAAPPAAAGVLGGVLTTVAAVGWLRFLPAVGDAGLAGPIIGLGLATTFVGAALGMFQQNSKALLAYSTVSQMGLLTAGVGLAMAGAWQTMTPLLLLFLFHHGLAKSAFLFGVDDAGTALGRPVWLAMVLLSLSLAGFPGTAGMVAKGGLEGSAGHESALAFLLPLSSAATAALMGRFLILARPRGTGHLVAGAWPSLLAATAALIVPWLVADDAVVRAAWSPAKAAAHAWPVVLGAAIAVLQWRLLPGLSLPAGDVAAWLGQLGPTAGWRLPRPPGLPRARRWGRTEWLPNVEAAERLLRSTASIGLLFAGISGALLLLVAAAPGWR